MIEERSLGPWPRAIPLLSAQSGSGPDHDASGKVVAPDGAIVNRGVSTDRELAFHSSFRVDEEL
jgi:hypothetical protein